MNLFKFFVLYLVCIAMYCNGQVFYESDFITKTSNAMGFYWVFEHKSTWLTMVWPPTTNVRTYYQDVHVNGCRTMINLDRCKPISR